MSKLSIKSRCQEIFKTHKATLVQDTDRFTIIDWRRADKSNQHYVNYIVDKERGSLIVSGDIGDSIATWFNYLTPSEIKSFIHNDIDYYISKFQISSDSYTYNADNILTAIKENTNQDAIAECVENNAFFDEDDLWTEITSEIENSLCNDTLNPTITLERLTSELCDIDYPRDWLCKHGKEISFRTHLWAEGFYMACEQLGL